MEKSTGMLIPIQRLSNGIVPDMTSKSQKINRNRMTMAQDLQNYLLKFTMSKC